MIHFPPPKRVNSPHFFQTFNRWNGKLLEPMAFEEKMNGFRAGWWRGVDHADCIYSRNGMPIDGTAHIHRALRGIEEIAGQRLFFDGEFVVQPTDGSNDTLAATKAWCESGWKSGANAGTLHLFDVMTEQEWREGGSDAPWAERKAWLLDLIQRWEEKEAGRWEWIEGSRGNEGPAPIRGISHTIVETAEEVSALVNRIWSRGGEGAVLKKLDSPYRRNRVATQVKVKKEGVR